jgi:hypothetical protein
MGKSKDPGQRVAGFRFSELMMNRIIWKDNFVAFTAVGFNYVVKSGGLHEKQVAETWEPSCRSSADTRTKLCRQCQSQDIQDTLPFLVSDYSGRAV